MPVCDPGSLPGFVGTVTTVTGRGSPAEKPRTHSGALEIPHLVDSSPPPASPGARSVGNNFLWPSKDTHG
jgi:hypothetical protein